MKRTILLVGIVVLLVVAVGISAFALDRSGTDSLGSTKEIAADAGAAMADYDPEKELIDLNGDTLTYTNNFELSVNASLASGDYTDRETVENLLLTNWLFAREAEAKGYTVADEEVDAFIREQQDMENENREDGVFDTYLASIGMSEEEYYATFRDQYRDLLLIGKYSDDLRDGFIREKVRAYLEEKGENVTEERIDQILTEEAGTINSRLSSEYNEYLKEYKDNLRNNILKEKTVVRESHEVE